MAALVKHLRSHVFGAAAVRVCTGLVPRLLLRQAEISNLEVAVVVDYDVFWLDIAVDDLLVVKIPEPDEDLNETITRIVFGHPLDLAQVVEELSSWTVCISKHVHSSAKATKFGVSKA